MLDSKVKKTMKGMMIGSMIYNLFVFIISTIIFIIYCANKNIKINDIVIFTVKNEICVLIGFVFSLIYIYNMTVALTKAVSSNDKKYAKRHIILMSMVRLILFSIILVIVINKKTFGLIGGIMYVIAVLGVKIGAYIAPAVIKRL